MPQNLLKKPLLMSCTEASIGVHVDLHSHEVVALVHEVRSLYWVILGHYLGNDALSQSENVLLVPVDLVDLHVHRNAHEEKVSFEA